MKTLPRSEPRCSGRFSLRVGGTCQQRDTCARYLAFTEWDEAAGLHDYHGISVFMVVAECQHKIEAEEIREESKNEQLGS